MKNPLSEFSESNENSNNDQSMDKMSLENLNNNKSPVESLKSMLDSDKELILSSNIGQGKTIAMCEQFRDIDDRYMDLVKIGTEVNISSLEELKTDLINMLRSGELELKVSENQPEDKIKDLNKFIESAYKYSIESIDNNKDIDSFILGSTNIRVIELLIYLVRSNYNIFVTGDYDTDKVTLMTLLTDYSSNDVLIKTPHHNILNILQSIMPYKNITFIPDLIRGLTFLKELPYLQKSHDITLIDRMESREELEYYMNNYLAHNNKFIITRYVKSTKDLLTSLKDQLDYQYNYSKDISDLFIDINSVIIDINLSRSKKGTAYIRAISKISLIPDNYHPSFKIENILEYSEDDKCYKFQ